MARAATATKEAKVPLVRTNVVLESLKIDYIDPAKLNPNTYNPNRMSANDFELLLRSMREDGFTQPVIVQRSKMQIVDGEHRWRASVHLGMPEIPIVLVDMTDEQMRIATLRHNRARGSEDMQLAAEVLRDLEKLGALDWAQDSLMLSDAEVQKLLADVPAPEALAGDSYTDAWNPQSRTSQEAAAGTVQAQEQRDAGGVVTAAMSVQALERQREHEQRLAQARTDDERATIARERVTYRLNLLFSDDEAQLVQGTLGERPAERILELCRSVQASY